MHINILNSISNENLILILSLVGVVILLLLVLIIPSALSRAKVKKMVQDLTKRYDSIHNLLTIELKDEMKRLFTIAQNNVEYENIYRTNNDIYEETLKHEDTNAQKDINDMNRLLAEKKYKIIKEDIDIAKNKVDILEEKYNIIRNALNDIINIDDENRQVILHYRRLFRDVRAEFEEKRNELKFVENSFFKVFDTLEDKFKEIEKRISGAHYVQAREMYPEVEKLIKALQKAVSVLPKLVTLSHLVIPSSIQELNERYQNMVQEGYPLHHLRVPSTLESFNNQLEVIHNKLSKLTIKDVEFELNKIRESIFSLQKDFDLEEESKNYFVDNYQNSYNSSYKIENRFIKLRRSIPDYSQTYILKDTCIDEMESIQNEINNLGTIKRTLDTYVHSGSSQPYTILADRLKELIDAMNKIDEDIKNIQKYLTSLRNDTENAYAYVTKVFLELKDYESMLRSINVPAVTLLFQNQIMQCHEYLSRCGDIILVRPIDVETLNENVFALKESYEYLVDKLKDYKENAERAELAIVYANQYRQEFYDVKTALLRSEKSFFEGDFVRACDETVSMVKKIRPEASK